MSTTSHETAGRTVSELPDASGTDTPRPSFTLTATHTPHSVCACPDCSTDLAPEPAFERILGCDMRGIAADWGSVGFCSYDCAEQFLALNGLRVDTEDVLIHWEETIVAKLVLEDTTGRRVVARSIGHDRTAAMDSLDTDIGALLADPEYDYDQIQIEFATL